MLGALLVAVGMLGIRSFFSVTCLNLPYLTSISHDGTWALNLVL